MADFEGLLISKIIASGDLEGATEAGIEASWFDDQSHKRVFTWMLEYLGRYGESPTYEAVKQEWPTFKQVSVPEPYPYYIDKFKVHRIRAIAVDALLDADKALKEEDPIRALGIMAEASHHGSRLGHDGISSVLASEVELKRVRWIWPGRVPRGKLTVVAGDSGQGKTTMVVGLIARLSSGGKLPMSKAKHKPMKCFIMTAEDDLADTLAPRLLAAGANLENVEFITGRSTGDGEAMLSLPEDIERLKAKMLSAKAGLLLIDPFNAFLNGGTDSYRDSDIRRVLAPLSRLAEETSAAVLLVFHLKKSRDGKALHQIVGSVGIGAAARSVLQVGLNPDNMTERVLVVTKMSNAPTRQSIVFRIEGTEPYGAAVAKWIRLSDVTADELTRPSGHSGHESALATGENFLLSLLSRNGGEMPVREVKDVADSAGIAPATLQRAKESLQIKSRKAGAAEGMMWFWRLPDAPTSPDQLNGS